MGERCSGNDNGFALNWFPGRLLDFFPNRSSHFPVLADLDLTALKVATHIWGMSARSHDAAPAVVRCGLVWSNSSVAVSDVEFGQCAQIVQPLRTPRQSLIWNRWASKNLPHCVTM
jgi:hypothetical protein